MKYFKFTEPYYAIIVSENEDKALDIYITQVCDSDEMTVEEISKEEVIQEWEKAGKEVHELVDLMQEEGILLVEGNLC